jgi:hypothetical protein
MGSLYRSQHELVLVFKQRGGPHRNNVQLGQFGRNRSNVWCYPGADSFARCGAEGNLLVLHPTVKPVALFADAILDGSARGDIVLDAFLGSGTTVIAAERTRPATRSSRQVSRSAPALSMTRMPRSSPRLSRKLAAARGRWASGRTTSWFYRASSTKGSPAPTW